MHAGLYRREREEINLEKRSGLMDTHSESNSVDLETKSRKDEGKRYCYRLASVYILTASRVKANWAARLGLTAFNIKMQPAAGRERELWGRSCSAQDAARRTAYTVDKQEIRPFLSLPGIDTQQSRHGHQRLFHSVHRKTIQDAIVAYIIVGWRRSCVFCFYLDGLKVHVW